MARITVEDCKKFVNNRFELIIVAAHRAREISLGSPSLVQNNDDKDVVLALKEIAGEKVNIEAIKEEVVKKHQKFYRTHKVSKDMIEDEVSELFDEATNSEASYNVLSKSQDLIYQDEGSNEN